MAQRISRTGWAARVAAGAGAVALGLTGMAAAGALPSDAQLAADDAVAVVEPVAEESAEDEASESPESGAPVPDDESDAPGAEEPALPVGSDEFSAWVREGANDADKVGREFGAAVSAQARELREEKAAEHAAASPPEQEVPGEQEPDEESAEPGTPGKSEKADKPDKPDKASGPPKKDR